MNMRSRSYRVGELAARVGISVRTLHHYDRLGLVQPSARSESGYRLYGEADLLRLQQVLTLRCLGLPLRRILDVLDGKDFDVAASLRIQRIALRERIEELRRVESAIAEALAAHEHGGEWDWNLVLVVAEAAGNSSGGDLMEKHYTPEEMAQFAELRAETSPEEIEAVEREWSALLADVRTSRGLDPASADAKALVARWDALQERTMAHFASKPGLIEAIGRNYEAGSFEGMDRAPQAEDFAFIQRVRERSAP
ncbi:MAG: MerR family transcriptional regulator [Chloroflexota bacterium]|nr:MerR family transcriptional regulator [Chloroflexota bacterium]MDE2885124.1 MerR family transcriptional regulator [Chloroflexota bacterium]